MNEIISVDLGNYNVKTSSGILFKSVYSDFDYKQEMNKTDCLTYEGRDYAIGVGDFDTNYDKSQKIDTVPLLLYGLAKSISYNYAKVNLVVGLPVDQHKNKELKDSIKNKFARSFKFSINGKDKGFSIENVIDRKSVV